MLTWFAACVLAFVVSALVAGVSLVAGILSHKKPPVALVFWGCTFLLGFLGPNLFSSLADHCLFTWPVCLYVAFHLVVLAYGWAERHPSRPARWLSRLALVAFLLLGYGYFELCKSVGMFIAWTFLFGFVAAFPCTFLAARATLKGQGRWLAGLWTLLAFAAYYWSCQGLLLWKEAQGA
jgi:hypothetical protein